MPARNETQLESVESVQGRRTMEEKIVEKISFESEWKREGVITVTFGWPA